MWPKIFSAAPHELRRGLLSLCNNMNMNIRSVFTTIRPPPITEHRPNNNMKHKRGRPGPGERARAREIDLTIYVPTRYHRFPLKKAYKPRVVRRTRVSTGQIHLIMKRKALKVQKLFSIFFPAFLITIFEFLPEFSTIKIHKQK